MFGKGTRTLWKKRNNSGSNSNNGSPKRRMGKTMAEERAEFNKRETQLRYNRMRREQLKKRFADYVNSNNNVERNIYGVNLEKAYFLVNGKYRIALHTMPGAMIRSRNKTKLSSVRNLVAWWPTNNARTHFGNDNIFRPPNSNNTYKYKNFVIVSM